MVTLIHIAMIVAVVRSFMFEPDMTPFYLFLWGLIGYADVKTTWIPVFRK